MPYVFNPFTGSFDDTVPLSGGKVPAQYLPSYVDDVEEYANLAAFPATGETGKIYLALNTSKIYRWSGSTYVIVGSNVEAVEDLTNVDVVTIPKQVGNPLVWNGSKWVASPTSLGFTNAEGVDIHYNSTVLQLNFDQPNNTSGAALVDDSPLNNTFTVAGTIGPGIVTTTNPKAGSGCFFGEVRVNNPSNLALPANTALTVEFWIRDWSTGSTNVIVATGNQSIRVSSTGQVSFIQPTSNAWTHPTLMVRGVWNHVALTRQAGSSPQWRLHVNGVASPVNTVGWSWSPSTLYNIGNFATVIDLFRQTNGVARYGAANFTPPESPYVKGNGVTLSTINTFDDVDTSTVAPTNGQALVWDQAAGKWEPGSVATSAQGTLADTALQPTDSINELSDVDVSIVTPVDGRALIYQNGKWVPGPVIGGVNYTPGSGEPFYNNVIALFGFNGTNGSTSAVDESLLGANITLTNGGSISTAESRFGGASLRITNSSSEAWPLLTVANNGHTLGTRNWTMECWFKPDSGTTGFQTLFAYGGVSNALSTSFNTMYIRYDYNNGGTGFAFHFFNGSNAVFVNPSTFPIQLTSNWQHVAFVRDGATIRGFVNGVQLGTYNIGSTSIPTPTNRRFACGTTVNGYIDEWRITLDQARYTANFTPPTAAFSRSSSAQVTLPYSIDRLDDVDTSTVAPTSNQTLIWNGTNWVPGTSVLLSTLKTTVAASTDFADFKTRVAAL